MRRLCLITMFCCAFLYGCASDNIDQTNFEGYEFHDEATKCEVEKYFGKTVSALQADDFKALADVDSLIIENPIESFVDIQNLFPNLQYLKITADQKLSDADFARGLSYLEISYPAEDDRTAQNNLLSFSVLKEDEISKNIEGIPMKIVRVAEGNQVYEMVLTDAIEAGEIFSTQERKVFVSNKEGEEVTCISILDGTSIVGSHSANQMQLVDVNFDGKKDILLDDGYFGLQMAAAYTCFLNNETGYERCDSFSEIANPMLDSENKKILSVWRNWAASHSWAMFEYDGSEYVLTDCLTEELVIPSPEDEDIWKYTIEKLQNGKMQVMDVLTTYDMTEEQINEKFFDEDSDWGILSDKWNTSFHVLFY